MTRLSSMSPAVKNDQVARGTRSVRLRVTWAADALLKSPISATNRAGRLDVLGVGPVRSCPIQPSCHHIMFPGRLLLLFSILREPETAGSG